LNQKWSKKIPTSKTIREYARLKYTTIIWLPLLG
jgi:hypothetical protein